MILPYNHSVSPWGHFAGLVSRSKGTVVFQIVDDPDAEGYVLWYGATPDDLYGNPTGSGVSGAGGVSLGTVSKGGVFKSPSVRRAGSAMPDSNRRGQTWVVLDLRDYTIPGDPEGQFYFAIQQIRNGAPLQAPAGTNANFDILGPMYVVPSAQILGMAETTISVTGTATDLGVGSAGATPGSFSRDLNDPNGPMMGLVLPRPTTSVTVRNTEATDGAPLAVAFGVHQPYIVVEPASEITTFGSVKEIYLASVNDDENPGYTVIANLGLGARGGV